MANCVQLYLTYGVVQAPGERLEQRKLRQEMGETLISWADEYFSGEEHLNVRLPRKDLYDAFCQYDNQQRKFVSPTAFKKKFIMYCSWKGYVYDKSGGVEYFTVGTGAQPIPKEDNSRLPQPTGKLVF